jgi:hypothetical protein
MGKALIAVAAALAVAPVALANGGDTHDVLPVYINSAGSAAEYAFATDAAAHPPPLARSLRVFSALPGAADLLPARLRRAFPAAPGTTPEPSRSRRLLAAGGRTIFAYPTRRGGVCYFLLPLGGGGCTDVLLDGALPQVEPGLVWGLIDDGAVRVDVRISRSRVLEAHRGRNAFLLELPKPTLVPSEIVVHERSGVRHVYTIRRCRSLTPLTGANPLAPPGC